MSDTEKQHAPSWKKLHEARRFGRVVISRDLSSSIGVLAATATLAAGGFTMAGRLSEKIARDIAGIADVARRDISPQEMMKVVVDAGLLLGATVGPIAIAAAATGLLVSLVQTRFNIATSALKFDFSALNPQNGLSRLTPKKAGIDTLKAIVIATAISYIAWRAGATLVVDAPRLAWAPFIVTAHRGWDDLTRLLWQVGFALLAFGGADYALQRWRLRESLKMSTQEVRQEFKDESNPEIKQRIRRVQREMLKKRMMKSVKTATVVITNPTHYAVALEYNRKKNPAPVVVAKGADNVAAKIRQIARESSVPIMENPPLARALFKDCEIGDTIPGPLFGAVAEVLAYLVRIKQLVI